MTKYGYIRILQRLPPKRDYAGNWSIWCSAVRNLKRIEKSIRNNVVWLMIFYMLLNKHTIVERSRTIRIIRNFCFIYQQVASMNTDRLYPSSTDDSALANTFADFFPEKISSLILELHLFLLLRVQLVCLPSAKWTTVSFINCLLGWQKNIALWIFCLHVSWRNTTTFYCLSLPW